jgi:YbbR domain-containing protein
MGFLTENLPLKLVSLALAAGLWFVIAGESMSEIGLVVPLELRNFPRDLELTGEAVNAVEVRLRASPGIIHGLSTADVSAQVDLQGATEGERIIHLAAEAIRVPFGVRVVKIQPSILTLKLERTLSRVVPIHPRTVGRPAPGYEVAEIESAPAEVRVAGPRSRVDRIESAFTEAVPLDGARTSVTMDRNIGLEDPLLRIQGSPQVRVTVSLREVRESRTLSGLRIEARGGAARLAPDSVDIVVEGPRSELRRITPEDLKPYVDASRLQRAGSLPVAVEVLPGHAGVTIESTRPAAVKARPLAPKDKKG